MTTKHLGPHQHNWFHYYGPVGGGCCWCRERDDLRQQIARLTEERDALRRWIHRVGYEPVGSPEATHRQVLDILTSEARQVLGAWIAAEADKEAGDG